MLCSPGILRTEHPGHRKHVKDIVMNHGHRAAVNEDIGKLGGCLVRGDKIGGHVIRESDQWVQGLISVIRADQY